MSLDDEARPRAFMRLLLDATDARDIFALITRDAKAFLPFGQAIVFRRDFTGRTRILCMDGANDVEQTSPYAVWLKRLVRKLPSPSEQMAEPGGPLDPGAWEKFALPFLLYLPFSKGPFASTGALYFRSTPWTAEDIVLARSFTTMASGVLSRGFSSAQPRSAGIWARVAVVALLAGAGFYPVQLTSIAPAEVVPRDPDPVASLFPAVVKRIAVKPNEIVKQNQIVVELDDADQRAKAEIARREAEVAEADYRRLSQLAMQDANSRYRLAEAQGQLEIKRLLLKRAELELERTKLRAASDGVAIVVDPLEWIGRPVQTGEKIVLIAQGDKFDVRLWVPASDGAILTPGLNGVVYLDSDPWRKRDIRVENWSYDAELSPRGTLAFRASAAPVDWPQGRSLLGLHGAAHLSGARLPLALYLLRRPIISLRQFLAL